MNIKSIRLRLTFWYAVSLIIAIIVIFASFYFTIYKALYTQIDNSLTSHSDKIVEVVTSQANNMHEDIAKEAFVREFSQIPGMFVVILSSTGTIISSSQTVNPIDETIRDLFNESARSEDHFFADKVIGSQKLRFLASPIYQNNIFLGVVIMGHPVEVIQTALKNLVSMLGIVFAVFLIPVILGGYLNARGAIQPISAISAKLRLINSGNLNERVDNPHTGDEIEELAVTFNSLLDRLHNAFQRERQFIGDVAHELKTPLTAQRVNLELGLSKSKTAEELREIISEAVIDNNQLSSTLKNILDLAWVEADSARVALAEVNLSEVIDELKELAPRMALKKNISIKGTVDANVKVFGKRDKFFGAILNIIDNAITYTPEKGSITLSLKKEKDHAKILISDTGVGIPPKDLPHIFERFYRGSKSNKEFGSGLGLAIANATITAFGGEIKVKSKVGKGSEFTILLPLSSS